MAMTMCSSLALVKKWSFVALYLGLGAQSVEQGIITDFHAEHC